MYWTLTERNYGSLTQLHTPKSTVTTTHTKSSQPSLPASNGGHSLSTGFQNCPRPQLPASSFSQLQPSTTWTTTQTQIYVTTDGQSATLSWCEIPIWGPRPDFDYCQTVASLLMWGALSDEKTGLSFTIAAGPRPRSHSWVRVPRDSWPYFTVSDLRLLQPGGPGSRIYVYIPQEQLYSQALGSLFFASYDSLGYGIGIRTHLHMDTSSQSQRHIATDSQSVSQSVLVSSPIWGSWADIN
jgi:hypothetical protein